MSDLLFGGFIAAFVFQALGLCIVGYELSQHRRRIEDLETVERLWRGRKS